MRFILFLLAATLNASAAEFERVWTAWRSAEYFDSLAEHLTGREHQGREQVHRSTPEDRAGYYFLVRLDRAKGDPQAARAVLEVIDKRGPEARRFEWQLSETRRRSQVYQFGLTGPDWMDEDATPLAWRLRLLDPTGGVLAERESFLWSAR
jgi:hypothetical protein